MRVPRAIRIAIFLVIVSRLFSVTGQGQSPSPDWLQMMVEKGPQVTNFSVLGTEYSVKVFEEKAGSSRRNNLILCSISFPAKRCRLAVRTVMKMAPNTEIYEEVTADNEIATVNGGYYGYGSKDLFIPLGLVISEGKTTNRKTPWTTGGMLFQKEGIRIVPIASFTTSDGIREAVQSKPILVKNSKLDIFSNTPDLHNRTAVGISKKGNVIIAGAFANDGKAVSLYDFARFLLIPESQGGPEAEIALAMDGGPSSHLYIPSLSKHFGYNGLNFVPNTVHFLPRS